MPVAVIWSVLPTATVGEGGPTVIPVNTGVVKNPPHPAMKANINESRIAPLQRLLFMHMLATGRHSTIFRLTFS